MRSELFVRHFGSNRPARVVRMSYALSALRSRAARRCRSLTPERGAEIFFRDVSMRRSGAAACAPESVVDKSSMAIPRSSSCIKFSDYAFSCALQRSRCSIRRSVGFRGGPPTSQRSPAPARGFPGCGVRASSGRSASSGCSRAGVRSGACACQPRGIPLRSRSKCSASSAHPSLTSGLRAGWSASWRGGRARRC